MRLLSFALCVVSLVPTNFLRAQQATTAGSSASAVATPEPALRSVQTIPLPTAMKGNFDHFEIDTKRNRLFATPEDAKRVLVLDLASGSVVHEITGIERPHAVLYRSDTDRLYITDGGDGSVRVYDAETYALLRRIPLRKDADSIGYDLSRKYLYVVNGGGDAHESFSMLTVIDTTSDRILTEIKAEGETLEAMALDSYRPRLYLNNKAKNTVMVIDRLKNTVVANWPITTGKGNVAMALDEFRQRLFIGCRDGRIIVLDTNTGAELQALPITPGVDDLIYDPKSRRLYAIGGGSVDTFEQITMDSYRFLGSVAVGAKARTGKLSTGGNRMFVAAPATSETPATIHVLEPVHTGPGDAPPSGAQKAVDAPLAEQLVLATLSAHPTLRRMGLHVIPPGETKMLLIANGNATRIGIATSAGDFAATRDGHTYGPLNREAGFYNMKLPMFDAAHRPIGILVMEIPATSAGSEAEAALEAEAIRAEVARKIPDLQWLFLHGR